MIKTTLVFIFYLIVNGVFAQNNKYNNYEKRLFNFIERGRVDKAIKLEINRVKKIKQKNYNLHEHFLDTIKNNLYLAINKKIEMLNDSQNANYYKFILNLPYVKSKGECGCGANFHRTHLPFNILTIPNVFNYATRDSTILKNYFKAIHIQNIKINTTEEKYINTSDSIWVIGDTSNYLIKQTLEYFRNNPQLKSNTPQYRVYLRLLDLLKPKKVKFDEIRPKR